MRRMSIYYCLFTYMRVLFLMRIMSIYCLFTYANIVDHSSSVLSFLSLNPFIYLFLGTLLSSPLPNLVCSFFSFHFFSFHFFSFHFFSFHFVFFHFLGSGLYGLGFRVWDVGCPTHPTHVHPPAHLHTDQPQESCGGTQL